MALKDIKAKIKSTERTHKVTRAMEAVSAVKMRKGQERALSGRAYAAAALSILEKLSGTVDAAQHPLMHDRSGAKTSIIVITSDKGLAGALNSGVIRAVEQMIREKDLKKEDVIIVGYGRRGSDYFASRGYDVRERADNKSDAIAEGDMSDVTRKILGWHESGEVGSVFVAYQNFISTFEQEPVVRQIVPITPEIIRSMVAGIRPARGKYAPLHDEMTSHRVSAYTIEPDADSILRVLLPKLVNISIFHALLESKASEHSARMVAMKNATDKAKEMAHNLTRTFNKVRQAAITREVSEITSGIEAMR